MQGTESALQGLAGSELEILKAMTSGPRHSQDVAIRLSRQVGIWAIAAALVGVGVQLVVVLTTEVGFLETLTIPGSLAGVGALVGGGRVWNAMRRSD
jgi:hypothetical protein